MNRNRVVSSPLFFCAIALACGMLIALSPWSRGEAVAEQQKSPSTAQQNTDAMHHDMEAMNHDIARLNRMVKDPAKKEDALALIQDLEQHTIAAKGMTPRAAATRPAAQRADYLTKYRQEMRNVLVTELDLEQQVSDGQTENAVAFLKQLRHLEQIGHEEFRPQRRHE
jgi:hypothetical protein